jgi:hypothetical protein
MSAGSWHDLVPTERTLASGRATTRWLSSPAALVPGRGMIQL